MVVVNCSIKIEQTDYDLPKKDCGDIFTVDNWTSITGAFSSLPKEFIEDLIDAAIKMSKEEAESKLSRLKGEKE